MVSVSVPSRLVNDAWVEATAYDVFDQDGRFRGRVNIPDRLTYGFLKGNELWEVWRDEYDVESIRRYTIRWPSLRNSTQR